MNSFEDINFGFVPFQSLITIKRRPWWHNYEKGHSQNTDKSINTGEYALEYKADSE